MLFAIFFSHVFAAVSVCNNNEKKKTSEGNLFLIASALPFAAANGDVEALAVAKGAFRAPRNKNSAPLASQKLDGAVRICAGGYKLSPPLFIPMSKHLF